THIYSLSLHDALPILNDLTYKIIGCAYKVHSELGPGLLESTYEVSLEYELFKSGLNVERQKSLPVIYNDMKLEAGYRIDLLVNRSEEHTSELQSRFDL